jgi:tRNA 2-thiocytidine biosynthesis protein TtcA
MIPSMVLDRLEAVEKRIARAMGEAIQEWNLIEEGDRILVGISGGKDSYTLLHLLRRFQERAPVRFDLLAFHLDQGHPGFPVEKIRAHLEREGFDHRIVRKDTYTLVMERLKEGETTCSLCSRYRRGILYNQAVELGCSKIALGHHREDAIETLLLNLFYSGQLRGMPARLESDDRRNVVIRPMIYAAEEDISEYAALRKFPIVPCTICNGTERDRVAALLEELSGKNPKVRGNILAAMRRVVPSHLLDARLPLIREPADGRPPAPARHRFP